MRELIQAEQALTGYTRKHARHIIAGELGNNSGTVDHATRTNFVYVKLHGDDNQVVEAEAVASFPHVAGIVVAVELVKRNAASRYQVLGLASNIMFVGSPWAGTVGGHADQHQRRDLGQGGFDPLDIYNRALVNLRGRAQATPDLTVYVERGFYFIGGALYEWTGGNSAAFTVPAGSFGVTVRRCDLLYIGSDQALHIVQGATTSDGSVPAYPTTPYPCIPIAYVYLTSSSTSIQENNIKDARVILTASDGTPVAHNLLSATHGDTLTASVVAGDLIIGNDTPKWSRLAITVPAANVRNVVGVDNGETKPSWKTALDATTPADIAGTAAAGTSLVFPHRDHVHRGVLSINKAADTTLYGAVTLSEGANITLTQVGQDIAIAATGGGAHTILSATHTDTLADTVVDGDVIIGNVTPKWSRLAISVPAANVRNVLGVDNGELRPSWKAALDATNPATLTVSAAAAPGTSLVFAHRDHVHPITTASSPGAAAAILATAADGSITLGSAKTGICFQIGNTATYAADSGAETKTLYGFNTVSVNVGVTASGHQMGVYGLTSVGGAGTVSSGGIVYGGYFYALANAGLSGTVDKLCGAYTLAQRAAGTVNTAYSLYVDGPTGTITTKYGIYQATASISNYFASPADFNAGLSIAAGTTYTAISSSPGAAAKILATDASGNVTVQGLSADNGGNLNVTQSSTSMFGWGAQMNLGNPDATTNNWAVFALHDGSGTAAARVGTQFTDRTNHYGTFVIATRQADAFTARATITQGLQMGAPTGGDKGVGTANFAGDIYKNNSAYTNPAYALEHWAEGSIITHADKPGAQDYRRLTLGEVEDYVRRHYELPGHRDSFGLFDGGDWLLEKVEELTTYVIELHHELEKLRGN